MKIKYHSKNPYLVLRKNLKKILSEKRIKDEKKLNLILKIFNKLDFTKNHLKYFYLHPSHKYLYFSDNYVLCLENVPSYIISSYASSNPYIKLFSEVKYILSNKKESSEKIRALETSIAWFGVYSRPEDWII